MALTQDQINTVNAGGTIQSSDPATQQAYSDYVKQGAAGSINSINTAPTTPITVPTPTTPTIPDTSGGQATIDAINKNIQSNTTDNSSNSYLDLLKKYAENPTTAPNLTDQYNTAYANAGIDAQSQDVATKKQELAVLNAQLAGLNAEANVGIPTRLQQESTGRGITAGGLAPIQAGQLRDIALRTLPVQAAVLAKQAELTGSEATLKLAQDKLDTVFNLKRQDAQNAYNDAQNARKAVLDYASEAEKLRLQQVDKQQTQNLDLYNKALADADSIRTAAQNNGQADLASEVTKLIGSGKLPLPTDKDFSTKIQDLYNALTPLQAKIVAKPSSTGAAGSLEEFKALNGRMPNSVAELNQFTAGRNAAGANITQTDKANVAISKFQNAFASTKPYKGYPIVGTDGYINPTAWKDAIVDAPKEGLNRTEFIKQFGYLLNVNHLGDYGLTPAELKLINGK